VFVKATGAQWVDSAVALAVDSVILITGVRVLTGASQVLVDTSLPRAEVDEIRQVVEAFAPRGVVGYHELRTRRAGNRRYVDLHLQFQAGTSLEDAHRTAHEVQEEIAGRMPRADVLIHLEPEDRVRPGERI
jgi:divalent metal cation (Fe/Co/Zn/Cd) transporter